MPPRYTKAEREVLTTRAVSLSARGVSYRDIAEKLGPNKDTVMKWVNDEFANRAEHREADKERSIAVYAEIIRAAWERFDETDNRSLNASGYLNTIKAAQERIDKITGAEAPIKVQDVDEEYEVVFEDADEIPGAP